MSAADSGGALSYAAIGLILLKATVFLVGSLILGGYVSPRLFSLASKLEASGVLLAVGLSFCFLLSWLASTIGLAPIVGAFAAGLILEDLHYKSFVDRGERTLEQLIEPISSFLVPVFFVLMGLRTDLPAFTKPGVLGLATALTAAAILGKQICSFGAIGKGLDRLSIGIGMIPRGEVGLIFADIGRRSGLLGEELFSALLLMVMITTFVAPVGLKAVFRRAPEAG
jgi:Kef-type K+ transport system membrane component KefB